MNNLDDERSVEIINIQTPKKSRENCTKLEDRIELPQGEGRIELRRDGETTN